MLLAVDETTGAGSNPVRPQLSDRLKRLRQAANASNDDDMVVVVMMEVARERVG